MIDRASIMAWNEFVPQRAYAMVKEAFIDKMPGKRD